MYLSANIITPYGLYANNRGKSEGNMTCLKTIFWQDGSIHVYNSSESIRHALRVALNRLGVPCNYQWDTQELTATFEGMTEVNGDKKTKIKIKINHDPNRYADDAIFGYMATTAGKDADARRGALEVVPGISFETADKMTVTFNSKGGERTNTSLYSAQAIATRFQWGFTINTDHLPNKEWAIALVRAVMSITGVAGNHGRFHYDFAPDSAIFRWSKHPVPEILYCFEPDSNVSGVLAPGLMEDIKNYNVPASELWILGKYAKTDEAKGKENESYVSESKTKGIVSLISQMEQDLSISS